MENRTHFHEWLLVNVLRVAAAVIRHHVCGGAYEALVASAYYRGAYLCAAVAARNCD